MTEDGQVKSRERMASDSTQDPANANTAKDVADVEAVRATSEGENHQHVTGLKLFAVLASVTLAAFLMLLDGSIIGVVSLHRKSCRYSTANEFL